VLRSPDHEFGLRGHRMSNRVETLKSPHHTPFILRSPTVRILYINNDGAGFADHIDVETGTTVSKLFSQRVPSGSASDYLIRVNRQPAASDQILQEGDRVSFTPVKIEGA
jgi:hypothetical protein